MLLFFLRFNHLWWGHKSGNNNEKSNYCMNILVVWSIVFQISVSSKFDEYTEGPWSPQDKTMLFIIFQAFDFAQDLQNLMISTTFWKQLELPVTLVVVHGITAGWLSVCEAHVNFRIKFNNLILSGITSVELSFACKLYIAILLLKSTSIVLLGIQSGCHSSQRPEIFGLTILAFSLPNDHISVCHRWAITDSKICIIRHFYNKLNDFFIFVVSNI